MPNRPLEGEKIFAFFWEHNFQSIPFEILGLKYFSRNKYEFIVHGASGRSWIDVKRLQQMENGYALSYRDEFHHELGIGIVMKYKFISCRLDAMRNLTNHNTCFGFSMSLIGMSF